MELFQVGPRGVWYYRFQVAGIRTKRSTRQTDRKAAQVVADEAYQAALLRRRGREPEPVLRVAVVQWLEAHRHIHSENYLRNVCTWARLHLGDLGGLRLSAISTERVEAQRAEYAQGHARSTVNAWARCLSTIMHWAMRRGMIDAIPYRIKMAKAQARRKPHLPAALTRTWLEAIDENDDWGAVSLGVRLMLGLGLRESEVLTARWEWLDVERSTYTPGQTKGREATPLPVPDWLMEYLAPLREVRGFMVMSRSGNRMYRGYMRGPMLRANEAVGAPHVTPHGLRGTYATVLAESGVPIPDLQRAMRHSDPRTTLGYITPNPGLVKAGQECMARRLGLTVHQSHSNVL